MIKALAPPPAAPAFWVAYSGGMDSAALLHWAVAQGLPGLHLVHVHHGLQASADAWAEAAAATAQRYQLPSTILHVMVDARHPKGPEAAAREARYTALASVLPTDAVLMTAHHQNDQAETVLLRSLRGTGVKGLAAMRPLQPFASGQLWRPFLATPRAQLHAWAREQGLCGVDDPHNHDPHYTRVWLRQTLAPVLSVRYPQWAQTLAQQAQHAAEANTLLDEYAAQLAGPLRQGGGWSVSALGALTAPQQRLVLRWAIAQAGLPPPPQALWAALPSLLQARADTAAVQSWEGGALRVWRGLLFITPTLPQALRSRHEWPAGRALQLATLGSLRAHGLDAPLRVQAAAAGQAMRPAGRPSKTLKSLAQEAGIPPWQRPLLPVIVRADTDAVVSIAGLWQAEGYGDLAGCFAPCTVFVPPLPNVA